MDINKGKNVFGEIHDSIVRTMRFMKCDIESWNTVEFDPDKIKTFALWFETKYQYIFHHKVPTLVVKKGEIYDCDFGYNIGCEQNKIRPAIILQNDKGNRYSPTTIVAPITDEHKKFLPTHVELSRLKLDGKVKGIILIEQIRCISLSRLHKKLGYINTMDRSWNNVIKAMQTELDVHFINNSKSTNIY